MSYFYCDICKATQSYECYCDDWDEERHESLINEIIDDPDPGLPMTQDEFNRECMLSWPEEPKKVCLMSKTELLESIHGSYTGHNKCYNVHMAGKIVYGTNDARDSQLFQAQLRASILLMSEQESIQRKS
jgi:hypothetical protein